MSFALANRTFSEVVQLQPDGFKLSALWTFLCADEKSNFSCIEYNVSLPLVIGPHLVHFFSKSVAYLRRKTVSHGQT